MKISAKIPVHGLPAFRPGVFLRQTLQDLAMTAAQRRSDAGLSWETQHMSPEAWQDAITRALTTMTGKSRRTCRHSILGMKFGCACVMADSDQPSRPSKQSGLEPFQHIPHPQHLAQQFTHALTLGRQ